MKKHNQLEKQKTEHIHVPNIKVINNQKIDVGTLKSVSKLTKTDKCIIALEYSRVLNAIPKSIQKRLAELLTFLTLISFFLMPLFSFSPLSTKGHILISAPNNVSIYLNNIWSDAEMVSKVQNIPLALILAQSCLESGFGKSRLAREQCNHHGIKYRGKYAEFSTRLESFQAYGNVLNQNCYGSPKDLQEWFLALECCGYAESKKYTSKLQKIIKKYKLYLL